MIGATRFSWRRGVLVLLVTGLVAVLAGGVRPVFGSAQSLSRADRTQIGSAFRRFLGPSVSSRAVRGAVESGSVDLARSLRRAATGFLAEFTQVHARMSMRVSGLRPDGAGVARVRFALIVDYSSGRYFQSFTGVSVRSDGRWRVGWTTACFVAETLHVSCPQPPTGVALLPLPEARVPVRFARPTLPGLVRPQALAAAPDGSLVIVDALRNQLFRRLADGRLQLLAGTGQLGFAGDGGSAARAELRDPSAVAVADDGSVYVADTGNGRVRVIALDGKIQSLAGTFDQPTGLALGRDGSLYVATANAIVKLDRNGLRTTFVRGHGRFGQITLGKRHYGFSPSYLALDAVGDVYAFSFGTKTIFEFSPSGKPLRAWQNDSNGLAEAPDGSIVVAEHGGTLQRIRDGRPATVFDFSRNSPVGYPKPGAGASFEPEGVAVDSGGTIYIDTFVGDGWTNQTALAELTPSGHGRLLRTTTPLGHTLAAVGATGFPQPLYPRPLPVRSGDDPSACPAQSGLRAFDRSTRAAATDAARHIDRSPVWNGLKLSDRSWWGGLYTDAIDGQYEPGLHRVLSVGSASRDPYSAAVARACGRKLVQDSLAVVVGPGVYSDQVSHLYFLDRDGHALLYWQHT